MGDTCQHTAYYLNGKLTCVALIARGVPFPPGRWIWVASDLLSPEHVVELVVDLFPALTRTPMRFVVLVTVNDVDQLEREMHESPAM